MKIYSFTTPDLGAIRIEKGTILRFKEWNSDDQPKRQGWVVPEFEILGYADPVIE